MSQRWGEVEFLLRIPIDSNGDVDLVHRTAYQSILLLNDIESISASLGVLQGALSRALMPYGVNTHAADQSWYSRPQDENIVPTTDILDRLGERECNILRSRLTDLRKLVRVKIADDGDLKQAHRAVTDIDAFCRLLGKQALKEGITPYDVLRTL